MPTRRPAHFAHAARNALRPGYARVMARKALDRLLARDRSADAASAWAREVRVKPTEVCRALDADLWGEATAFMEQATARAKALSKELGVEVGFGARCDLLYFVTRLTKPQVIVETGVAFGYSSYALLSAIDRNGCGHLYSSDFPFFRERDPERLIGAMVPEALRDRWTLLTRGDDENIPEILATIGDAPIDLLHYDSDKSYAGRTRAMKRLEPHLAEHTVLVMDDIEDNTYFRDFVRERPDRGFLVFGPGPHFIGSCGLPVPPA